MNQLIDSLRLQNVSLINFPNDESTASFIGTLVYENIYLQLISLNFSLSDDKKWIISFIDKGKIIKSFQVHELNWRYLFTFIVFNENIYFYSKSSNLAILSSYISMIQEIDSVPCSNSLIDKNNMLIVLMKNKGFTKFGKLFVKDINDIEDNYLKNLKISKKYNATHGIYEIYAFVIPYIFTEIKGKKKPCFYPSNLPKKAYPDYNDNAIIQGIRALKSKIDSSQAILSVEEETPLELAKQKLIVDTQKLECQIEMKKKDLMFQLNNNQNQFLDNIIKTVSPNKPLSSSINFNGHYEIPSSDVCLQIQKIIDSI